MQAQQTQADQLSQAQPTQAQPTQADQISQAQPTTEGATTMTAHQNSQAITTTDLLSFEEISEIITKDLQQIADRIAPNTFIIDADVGENTRIATLLLNTQNLLCNPFLDNIHLFFEPFNARQDDEYSNSLLSMDAWFKLTAEGSKEGFLTAFEEQIKAKAKSYKHTDEGLKLLAESGLIDLDTFESWDCNDVFEDIGLEDGVQIGNQLVKAKLSDEGEFVPFDFEITATATSTADTDLISFKEFGESVSKDMQSVADRIAPNTFRISASEEMEGYAYHDTFAELFLNTDVISYPLLDIYFLCTHEESEYAHLGANIVYAVEQISKIANHENKLLTMDDWFKLTSQGSKEGFLTAFEEDIKFQAKTHKHSIKGLNLLAKHFNNSRKFSWNCNDVFEDIGLEDGVQIGNQLVKAKLTHEFGNVPYNFEIINLK